LRCMLPSDKMAKFLETGYRQFSTLFLGKSVVIFDKGEYKVQN